MVRCGGNFCWHAACFFGMFFLFLFCNHQILKSKTNLEVLTLLFSLKSKIKQKIPLNFLFRSFVGLVLDAMSLLPFIHFANMQILRQDDNPRPTRLVWWTPPPRGFFKLNCDGAFTVYGNKGAAGGVLRDWKGEFILGFSDALIECSSALEAELWAIKIGMQTVVARGYRNLIVESDSLKAIQIINAHKGDFLRSSIQHMTRMVDRICWNHVYRETNSVADGFAKHGLSLSQDQSIRVFESAPDFIESRLYGDRIGKIYCR